MAITLLMSRQEAQSLIGRLVNGLAEGEDGKPITVECFGKAMQIPMAQKKAMVAQAMKDPNLVSWSSREIARQLGLSVTFVSHERAKLGKLRKRVIYRKRGKVSEMDVRDISKGKRKKR